MALTPTADLLRWSATRTPLEMIAEAEESDLRNPYLDAAALLQKRKHAAEARLRVFLDGRDKIAMGPNIECTLPDSVVTLHECNSYLAAHGFPDFDVEHHPTGTLRLVWRAPT